MYDAQRIIGVTGRAVAILLVAMCLASVLSCGAFAAEASPKVRELTTLLAEEWLKEQGVTTPAAAPPAQQTGNSFHDYINSDADAILYKMVALADAIPGLPHEFEWAATRVTAIDADSGVKFSSTSASSGTPFTSRTDAAPPRSEVFSTSPYSAPVVSVPYGSSGR